jgi:hypothetical protein
MVENSSRRKAGADPTRYYECNRKMHRSDYLAKKKTVDLYVHVVKAFPDKVEVLLKLNLGADKDGVGGATHIVCNYLEDVNYLCLSPI